MLFLCAKKKNDIFSRYEMGETGIKVQKQQLGANFQANDDSQLTQNQGMGQECLQPTGKSKRTFGLYNLLMH